jgi:predicted metal-binding protein
LGGKDDFTRLCRLAVTLGAVDAKVVPVDQVVVKDWVRWKCHFGCDSYGTSLMCPPHSPTPDDTRALLTEYEYALLFRVQPDAPKRLAADLERRIFLEGYPAALAFTSGSCKLCEQCNLHGGACVRPFEARPSMESCGISVFDTARNAGYEIAVLTSKDQRYLRYGLVLIQ